MASGSRVLPSEILDFLRFRAKEWIKDGHSARELATAAGISPAQLSFFLSEAKGAGWKTANGLAAAFGLTFDQLWSEARRWASTQPKVNVALPNRTKAAELSREDGVHERAIRQVLEAPALPGDERISVLAWARRMKLAELDLLGGGGEEKR